MDENYNGTNQQPGDEGAQPTQKRPPMPEELGGTRVAPQASEACLLYTSDAADDCWSV